MTKITLDQIKKLRSKTKAGVMDCRKALEACGGNEKKAEEWLRKKGIKGAEKREDRETSCGFVASYLHHDGTVGSLASLACETDFVARTDDFRNLANEIAMQAAGTATEKVEELLDQPWIRDESRTVNDLIKELSAKTGENIVLEEVKVLSRR